jgi:hypothetical protein
MKTILKSIIPALMLLMLNSGLPAQVVVVKQDNALTASAKKDVVNKISELLISKYVFPDIAVKMKEKIMNNLEAGNYDAIESPKLFAEQLTKDLIEAGRDKHVNVNYNPKQAKNLEEGSKGPEAEKLFMQNYAAELKTVNYNFKELKILDGNIGYLNLTGFAPIEFSKETVTAAMKFLENTDAVIIDLRDNGGGNAEAVQLLCSYFFDAAPRHLNSLYYKETNETQDFYSLEKIDGKRMTDVPLYVLTSGYTFSAAEEFSYNMQTQKRATLVGEVTGGGANPNDFVPAGNGFILSVSIGRAINPITKTNWEGTGVKPDIETPRSKAFDIAYTEALKTIIGKTSDPKKKNQLVWKSENIAASLNPYDISGVDLSAYAGTFGNRIVTFLNGELYYEREGIAAKKKIIPFAADTFIIEGVDFFRLKFERDPSGRVIAITGLYDNGNTDRTDRSN